MSSTYMCKKARKTTKQWMRMLPVSTLHHPFEGRLQLGACAT